MKRNTHPFLTLIIPCYNESKRITSGLTHALGYLRQQSYSWEIVLINDGSTDKTVELAQKLLKGMPHQILTHQVNLGKGAAIRSGVAQAHGVHIIFSDIDFSTPLFESEKLIKALKKTAIAIGVRRHPESRVLKHQPKMRETLGHVFTQLTNILTAPGVYDATCGFKGFRKEAAKKLFRLSRINAWAFDAEILFLARKFGFNLTQVPIIWKDNPSTKVHIMSDGIKAFLDLIHIRIWDILGRYERSLFVV